MDIITSVVLGALQGATEFLPVSSSAHLAICKYFFGLPIPDILFDVLLHGATLLAVIIFFRQRVCGMIKGVLGIVFKRYAREYYENKNFIIGIIIATIPTALIGYYFDMYLMQYFSSLTLIGYALIVTSLLLALSDSSTGLYHITPLPSLFIGIAQGIAVIPGLSRSGTTIAISMFLKISRQEAAEFSFLMSVPAIVGAVILKVHGVESFDTALLLPYIIGMVAAFVVGFFFISVVVEFIHKAKLSLFSLYCLLAGTAVIIFA